MRLRWLVTSVGMKAARDRKHFRQEFLSVQIGDATQFSLRLVTAGGPLCSHYWVVNGPTLTLPFLALSALSLIVQMALPITLPLAFSLATN
jgi:hypothetical protein